MSYVLPSNALTERKLLLTILFVQLVYSFDRIVLYLPGAQGRRYGFVRRVMPLNRSVCARIAFSVGRRSMLLAP